MFGLINRYVDAFLKLILLILQNLSCQTAVERKSSSGNEIILFINIPGQERFIKQNDKRDDFPVLNGGVPRSLAYQWSLFD